MRITQYQLKTCIHTHVLLLYDFYVQYSMNGNLITSLGHIESHLTILM